MRLLRDAINITNVTPSNSQQRCSFRDRNFYHSGNKSQKKIRKKPRCRALIKRVVYWCHDIQLVRQTCYAKFFRTWRRTIQFVLTDSRTQLHEVKMKKVIMWYYSGYRNIRNVYCEDQFFDIIHVPGYYNILDVS